jgi:hypothetical protein
MILDSESWMNIRRFRALYEAGATYTEIAEWCGLDWRTLWPRCPSTPDELAGMTTRNPPRRWPRGGRS